MAAYIYLLEEVPHPDEESGQWTKIGYTGNNPEWRLNHNIKMGNSRLIRLAAVYQFGSERDARDAEREAHTRFIEHLMRKEWFNVDWETVAKWCGEVQGWKLRDVVALASSENVDEQAEGLH